MKTKLTGTLSPTVAESLAKTAPKAGTRLVVTLPLPPPLSALFNNYGRRRIESEKYRKWKQLAALTLMGCGPVQTPCEVRLSILPGKGWRRGCDICNREKACIDALVQNGVIPDDDWEHVRKVTMEYRWRPDKFGPAVVLVDVATIP